MRSSTIRIEMIAAVAVTLTVALNSSGQTPSDARVHELIRKARGSIVTITGENRAGEPVPAALGFVIDDKLVATSYRILPLGALLHVNPAGQESAKSNVSYSDSYREAMIMTMPSWLRLDALAMGDSDKVVDNDRVYFYADPDPQVEAVEATIKGVSG